MDLVSSEIENINVFRWQSFLRQLFTCSVSWVIYFSFGLSLGVTTVAVPQLRREANSTAAVDDEMVSWISSISGWTAVISVLILGQLVQSFGRIRTVLLISIMSFIGFLVLYLSKSATHVLISQAFQGPANASVSTLLLLVMAECTSPKYRGIFVTIQSATTFWGIWVANAIGTFFDYRNIGLLGMVCSIYGIAAIFLIPESPYLLACKNKYEECSKSHRWFFGVDDQNEKNLEILIKKKQQNKDSKKEPSIRSCVRFMLKTKTSKPIALCFLLTLMYYSFGKFVCTVYSIQILKYMIRSESKAYIVMLILDGFTVSGIYMGCGLAKVIKRRTLIFSASIITILFLCMISIYSHLVKFMYVAQNTYVTVVFLTGFSIGVCCGPVILVTAINPEMIPLRSRFLALSFIALPSIFVQSIILKISPYMFHAFGFEGTFVFFAISSTIFTLLVYRYLPETKDESLYTEESMFKEENCSEQQVLKTLTED